MAKKEAIKFYEKQGLHILHDEVYEATQDLKEGDPFIGILLIALAKKHQGDRIDDPVVISHWNENFHESLRLMYVKKNKRLPSWIPDISEEEPELDIDALLDSGGGFFPGGALPKPAGGNTEGEKTLSEKLKENQTLAIIIGLAVLVVLYFLIIK